MGHLTPTFRFVHCWSPDVETLKQLKILFRDDESAAVIHRHLERLSECVVIIPIAEQTDHVIYYIDGKKERKRTLAFMFRDYIYVIHNALYKY